MKHLLAIVALLLLGCGSDKPTEPPLIVDNPGPQVDPLNRTVPVYVRAKAEQNGVRLRPGMFARGRIRLQAPRQAILIPRRFVQNGFVFLVDNHQSEARARRHALNVEEMLAEHLVLAPGGPSDPEAIRPGDRMITSNLEMLYDGTRIRTAPDAAGDVP